MTSLASKHDQAAKADTARQAAEIKSLRMQLRHSQRLATVGTMTAMIVHEFNNILTPIINYAHLAAGGDPEMVKKAVTKAAEGGQRASDICNALLGLLRSEATESAKVNLRTVVEESMLAMGRSIDKDGIALDISIPGAIDITTRPAELKQVIVNLLINARAAVLQKGRGGSVSITAAKKGKSVRLTISDSGVGIAPEHKERLFQPFFTTKTSPEGEKGTGLGLAICKEIMTNMGGDISVESEPGKGAAFTISLPA